MITKVSLNANTIEALCKHVILLIKITKCCFTDYGILKPIGNSVSLIVVLDKGHGLTSPMMFEI